ncbi:MAG TPA: tRNA epoxyqueuosine(34) reductase QueG [Bacteroidales bacterium]|nr:tRNA epoxyqueuosine(34) reductase QueG [Bacteroidales bacterium]
MSSFNQLMLSAWIKQRASELGFSACGIAPAGYLEDEAPRLEQWLRHGLHGEMKYMENNFDKRLDPRKLVDGAKSVIVFLKNYFPKTTIPQNENYILSKYAYGEDYHNVIKDKLYQLIDELKQKAGNINARPFVDSAPVLERAWAEKAGLGWTGKNTCFIVPKKGSFFFIAEIITDLELACEQISLTDRCGNCRKCIDACPTQAIIAPYVIDAAKCISYLTIELKSQIPADFEGKLNDRMFGCDICQDVCPWNRFSSAHDEPRFIPDQALHDMKKDDWSNLSRDIFDQLFKKSAVKRTRYEELMRNIRFLSSEPDQE